MARWLALAAVGLVVAVGVAYAASRLASPEVGLVSEPVSAGAKLAPKPARPQAPAHPRKKRRRRSQPPATTSAPPPPAATTATTPPQPPPTRQTNTSTTPSRPTHREDDGHRDD
jgi:hypothetical protein